MFSCIPSGYFSVGIGRYFSVFTIPIPKENPVSIRYQKFGGSPSKNWREPPFSQEGGALAPSLYTSPSF